MRPAPFVWTFFLADGCATIQAPRSISSEEVEELEQVFRIIVRTLMRHTLSTTNAAEAAFPGGTMDAIYEKTTETETMTPNTPNPPDASAPKAPSSPGTSTTTTTTETGTGGSELGSSSPGSGNSGSE
jgi:hypothetical protein